MGLRDAHRFWLAAIEHLGALNQRAQGTAPSLIGLAAVFAVRRVVLVLIVAVIVVVIVVIAVLLVADVARLGAWRAVRVRLRVRGRLGVVRVRVSLPPLLLLLLRNQARERLHQQRRAIGRCRHRGALRGSRLVRREGRGVVPVHSQLGPGLGFDVHLRERESWRAK